MRAKARWTHRWRAPRHPRLSHRGALPWRATRPRCYRCVTATHGTGGLRRRLVRVEAERACVDISGSLWQAQATKTPPGVDERCGRLRPHVVVGETVTGTVCRPLPAAWWGDQRVLAAKCRSARRATASEDAEGVTARQAGWTVTAAQCCLPTGVSRGQCVDLVCHPRVVKGQGGGDRQVPGCAAVGGGWGWRRRVGGGWCTA